MNKRFIEALKKCNMSQYILSKRSGVPFSTVNGLVTEKHSINKCSSASVLKLASIMNVTPEKLLDPYPVMDGVSGKYLGWSYKWSDDNGSMILSISKDTKKDVIETQNKFHFPEDMQLYYLITEMLIDRYLYEKEIESKCQELMSIAIN